MNSKEILFCIAGISFGISLATTFFSQMLSWRFQPWLFEPALNIFDFSASIILFSSLFGLGTLLSALKKEKTIEVKE